jgi:DNA-binding NtrC family response regulator
MAGERPVFLGESPAAESLRNEIASAARTQAKVLILGETGTGKEVVARLIHAQSARSARPFVAVNCSGIPETLLESELFGHVRGSFTGAYRDKVGLVRQADRGTLFLDELGEMSLRMQAILLRFAETGEIQPVGADSIMGRTDARLIAATNRDLLSQVREGEFREDLYYRLNVIQITVPALRARKEDIMLLMRHYLGQASGAHRLACPELTPDCEQLMIEYAWPGNVRELKNVAERLVVAEHGRALRPDDLPRELRGSTPASVSAATATEPLPPAAATPVSPYQTPSEAQNETAVRLWNRLLAGEDFWESVYRGFKAREITRADLASLVDIGLRHTNGSYRGMLTMLRMPASDYRRFHAFLYQQRCNLPVAPYRRQGVRAPAYRDAPRERAS